MFYIITILILVAVIEFFVQALFHVPLLTLVSTNLALVWMTPILQIIFSVSLMVLFVVMAILLAFRVLNLESRPRINRQIAMSVVSFVIILVLDFMFQTYYGFPIITKILAGY